MTMYYSYGRSLAEVFSVNLIKVGSGTPSGTISVFDGKRGQVIYRRDQPPSQTKPSNSDAQNGGNERQLLLTGPYRAISADGCIAIEFELQGRRPTELLLDVYSPSTEYDEAVTEEVDGAEVTYALLSNAVEATVKAELLRRGDGLADRFSVHKIIASTDVGTVLLFESDEEEEEEEEEDMRTAGSPLSQEPSAILLARTVLAVPLGSPLKFEVQLSGRSSTEVLEGSAKCHPDLDSEQVLHLVGKNGGQVDLKITWSD